MAQKVKISGFLNYFKDHAVLTNKTTSNPPAHQFGYVMGGDGRVATDAYLQHRAKSSYPSTWKSHYNDTLKWLGREVYDCNAAAEAYYRRQTGINIDTKARLNYANWCTVKSSSSRDSKLSGMPQLPGIALFAGGTSAAGITHVGFLFEKYGDDPLDWYVLEMRGRNYGCVITRIKDRSWRYWGKMDKYFEYDLDANWSAQEESEGDIMIKAGQKDGKNPGAVYLYQKACNRAGYDIGTWPDLVTGEPNGQDGSLGNHMQEEVNKEIQKKYGLPQTGEVDALTYGLCRVRDQGRYD